MLLFAMVAVLASAPSFDDHAFYTRASDQVAAAYDSARGGFVTRDGVPSESAVELALIRGREPGSERWMEQGLATIAWTRALRDTFGGGYVRGAADLDPGRPRLDKLTSFNARRLENLIAAWRRTSEPEYRTDAVRVVDYFDRVLLDGRGGFASGQGADVDLMPEPNGIAIRAWLEWAAATRDPTKRDFATRSLDRVWDACWVPNLGLMRKGTFGEMLAPPQLVDQVEMGRALVLAERLVERRSDAERSRHLGDLLLAHFEDPREGGFRTQWVPTRDGKGKRAARVAAENARACRFLCELTALTGDAKYRDAARRAWQALGEAGDARLLDAADWALAVHSALDPALPQKPQWPAKSQTAASSAWRPIIIRPRSR